MMFEYNLSGKWLELLKEIAPSVRRAAILRDTSIAAGIGQFAIIQSVAPSVGVDVTPIDLRDASEIERAGDQASAVYTVQFLVRERTPMHLTANMTRIELGRQLVLTVVMLPVPSVTSGSMTCTTASS